jgi:hypothetical protein
MGIELKMGIWGYMSIPSNQTSFEIHPNTCFSVPLTLDDLGMVTLKFRRLGPENRRWPKHSWSSWTCAGLVQIYPWFRWILHPFLPAEQSSYFEHRKFVKPWLGSFVDGLFLQQKCGDTIPSWTTTDLRSAILNLIIVPQKDGEVKSH